MKHVSSVGLVLSVHPAMRSSSSRVVEKASAPTTMAEVIASRTPVNPAPSFAAPARVDANVASRSILDGTLRVERDKARATKADDAPQNDPLDRLQPAPTQAQIREAHRNHAHDGEISDREPLQVIDVLRAASANARA